MTRRPYLSPLLAVLGTAVASATLILGSRVGGPMVRSVFGEPLDFKSDYTSPHALGQAVGTLLVALIAAFGGVGALLVRVHGPLTVRDAWWVANPLSMSASYVVHYSLSEGALGWSRLTYAYYGHQVFWLLVVGSVVWGQVLLMGARLGHPGHPSETGLRMRAVLITGCGLLAVSVPPLVLMAREMAIASAVSERYSVEEITSSVRGMEGGALRSEIGGHSEVTVDFYASNDSGECVAVQPDGRIIVGGFARDGTSNTLALMRLVP